MAYHFDTRRLVFLKTTALVDLVQSLESFESVDEAVASVSAGDEHKTKQLVAALSSLEEAGVICER